MKTRILVIGGGVGAITAVYAITRTPGWQERFDITVHQMGWRLGGKGASGRNLARDDQGRLIHGARIEEHGLHVWAGFYENAFANLRHCYRQMTALGLRSRSAPLGSFEAAFHKLGHIFLSETVGGRSVPWCIDLPVDEAVPGDGEPVPTPFEMFLRVVSIMSEFLAKGAFGFGLGDADAVDPIQPLRHRHEAVGRAAALLGLDPRRHLPGHRGALASLVAEAQDEIGRLLARPDVMANDDARRSLMLVDLTFAYMAGMLASEAFRLGYDVLDDIEFTDWLRRHGASEVALNSVLLRGCYDFVFGFRMGRADAPSIGAGTAVRAMTRLILTYRGAIFWQMQAGMGDTVFAPYYLVLRQLGVKFEFFSAATALRLSEDGQSVARVEMVRQARLKDPSRPYEPLVDVKGLPCWPSAPDEGQVTLLTPAPEQEPPQGEAFTLEAGRDFDVVILGASIGSLGAMTAELSHASARWRRMLDAVKTVGTQAAQFWMTKSPTDMGWDKAVARHTHKTAMPKGPLRTMLTGFAEPLDTWADLTHLLPAEDWGTDAPPVSLAYFCSPAPEGQTVAGLKADIEAWTPTLADLWPEVATAGLRPLLANRPGLPDALDAQYLRVNMVGSERYVLSVPGSVFHRLAPDESGFANLYLAGDWTRCGINAGCVEAATMSGMACAAAVTGADIEIPGARDLAFGDTVAGQSLLMSPSVTRADWPINGLFARGEMTGWFTFAELPTDEVRAMLPKGVHLGPARDRHLIGMSFCRYTDVRGSFVPNPLAMRPYGEATIVIPDTHTADGGGAHFLYPRRLYVDSLPAILAGRGFYAMDKVRAQITQDDRRFSATTPRGLRLEAQFSQRDDPAPLISHPAAALIASLINQSFVTRRASGRLLYNAFSPELDRAYVAGVSGTLTVRDPDPSGFPTGAWSFVPIEAQPRLGVPGAFRIWCSWSMTNPLDSHRVLEAARSEAWLGQTYGFRNR